MTTEATRTRLDVADLRRHPGDRREVHLERPFDDLRVGEVEVPPDCPVVVDLVLEAVQGGVEATGHATATWAGPCRRCLEPVEADLDVEIGELFVDDAVEGETYPIDHDVIDLEPLVRDAVLLALPLAPLCREDCPGPDPDAFPVGSAEDEEGGGEPARDPRWAALDVLRAELEEAEADSRSEGPVD